MPLGKTSIARLLSAESQSLRGDQVYWCPTIHELKQLVEKSLNPSMVIRSIGANLDDHDMIDRIVKSQSLRGDQVYWCSKDIATLP